MRRAAFLRLPAHRTLFRASAGCGLPNGNQTYEFGANVYLDALDQFIKHALKARYYVRDCDDMMLLSTDPAELAAWERAIGRFLDERPRGLPEALAAAGASASVARLVPRALRAGVVPSAPTCSSRGPRCPGRELRSPPYARRSPGTPS